MLATSSALDLRQGSSKGSEVKLCDAFSLRNGLDKFYYSKGSSDRHPVFETDGNQCCTQECCQGKATVIFAPFSAQLTIPLNSLSNQLTSILLKLIYF